MNSSSFEIKTLEDAQLLTDAVGVINAYLEGWPYARRIDQALTDHWRTMLSFQPEHIWIAYHNGIAQAVLHGEVVPAQGILRIHLLAVRPGGMAAAIALLQHADETAQALKLNRLIGPHWATAMFHGGYVLGNEPYHPHFAVEATEAFVRAGFHITLFGVLMACDLSREVVLDETPTGYEIVAAPLREEFGAQPFGFLAFQHGVRAAHCYARWYPNLIGVAGGSVGQIGNVTTEEAHRGKGLARVMVQMCLQQLREWGAAEALIATRFCNAPALRAYERAGFERRHNINEWTKKI